jgi:uncharacterized protein
VIVNGSNSPFVISVHDLRRQPGELLEIKREFPTSERIGIDIIAIEAGTNLAVVGKVESVSTGVLASFEISSQADGECVRCLDSITIMIQTAIQELYYYSIPDELGEDEEEPLLINEEKIDLLPPIRDAVILDLPLQPHCSEECLGLCPDCGEKIAENPTGHDHQNIDPRWAKLREVLEPE